MEKARELKAIITKYCMASGQQINNVKSNLVVFTKGAPEGSYKAVEEELQIRRVHDPGKYLGVPSV